MTELTKRGLPAVRRFADAMMHQLDLNKYKGDWKGRPVDDSIWQVVYHFVKLVINIQHEEPDPLALQEFAADVGNEAMILADNLGVLEQVYASNGHSIERGHAMNLTDDLCAVLIKWGILPEGFEPPPVTPAQLAGQAQVQEAITAKLEPKERALWMISESHKWKEMTGMHIGGLNERMRMVAKWGLEGDEDMLDKAEVALGLKDGPEP